MNFNMFCKNCGNEIKDGVKFCGKCGVQVKAEFVSKTEESSNGNQEDIKTNDEVLNSQNIEDKKLTASDVIIGSIGIIIPIAVLIVIIILIVNFVNGFKFSIEMVQEGSPTFYTEHRTEEDKELGELYLETFSDVEIGEVLEYCFDNTQWKYKENVNDGLGGKWDIVEFTGTYIDDYGTTQNVRIDFRKYRWKEYLFSKATRKQFCVEEIIDTSYTYGIFDDLQYELSDEEIYYYLKNCLELIE